MLKRDLYYERIPTKSLRDDVRYLGNILGRVIKKQEGESFFNLVEKVRKLSKANKNSSTDRKNAVINAVYLHAECSNHINKRHILASDIINVLGDVQTRLIEKNET